MSVLAFHLCFSWSQCIFLPFQLSKFLQCMQKDHSLIHVKELSKGVESIVEVYWRNPEYAVTPFHY